MPQLLSPGVTETETSNITSPQGVSTSVGGIAGVFRWGPIGKLINVQTESNTSPSLVGSFGKPSNLNPETWFVAASYLAYSTNLWVSRAANTSANLVTWSFPVNANLSSITDNNMIITASSNVVTTNNVTLSNTAQFAANVGDYVLFQQLTKANTANVVASNYRQVTAANSTQISLDQPLTFTNANTLTNIVTATKFAGSLSAFANTGVVDQPFNQVVLNSDLYTTESASFNSTVLYIAKYPSDLGNSLRVSVCDSASAYTSNLTIANCYFTAGALSGNLTFANNTAAQAGWALLSIGDYIGIGNTSVGIQYTKITSTGASPSGNVVTITLANKYSSVSDFYGATSIQRNWEFYQRVTSAPGQSAWVAANGNTAANDQLHVVVVDQAGLFSGTPGTVLEVYQGLSRANDSFNSDGSTSYYKNVLNNQSPYIWFANDRTGATSANSAQIASSTNQTPLSMQMICGNAGPSESTIDVGSLAAAWNLFQSKESVDVDLLLAGKSIGGTYGEQMINYIYDNVVSKRLDCIVCGSPAANAVVNNPGQEVYAVTNFTNAVEFNTYIELDSGYKYTYDRYNDTNRWVPLNGDVAGTMAEADANGYPWDSPGGLAIKNCIKLAWNPKKSERDIIYPLGVNPVVTFPGEGTQLFGDNMHVTAPTLFKGINVRRAFLYFEKSIAPEARAVLFRNNTTQTQRNFVASIKPFFDNVYALNGINAPAVIVADSSVNIPAVVNAKQFVCQLYIQPVQSINWVLIGFNAEQAGVTVTETTVSGPGA